MKLLLQILILLGISKAYAGTSDHIMKVCKESGSSSSAAASESASSGTSGCLRC